MRPYVVFGSTNGGGSLQPLGIFEAPDHDAARKLAHRDEFSWYGSVPVGNWEFGELKAKTVIEIEDVELPFPDKKQLTVEDALKPPGPPGLIRTTADET